MLLLCHMSHLFYFQKAGVQIHTVLHTAEKREAGIMLILSDGSICGIVASTWPVTNRVGWLPAIQQLHHHFCSGSISMFILRITLAPVTAQINQS